MTHNVSVTEEDLSEILDKGLTNENNLCEIERKIYVVLYLETVADMEGWDFFFIYKMEWYEILINTLKTIGDRKSLQIIFDYEKHFRDLNILFTSASIDDFLLKAEDHYFESCPDWRELFSANRETRMNLLIEYYQRIKGKT